MATFRRVLKYTPAAVMGVLVVAWVVSPFLQYAMLTIDPVLAKPGDSQNFAVLVDSSLGVTHYPPGATYEVNRLSVMQRVSPLAHWHFMGSFDFGFREGYRWVRVPIPCLLAALLPIAVGSFTRFRFRLWHYLAYTALVAVELAYYLRWQE